MTGGAHASCYFCDRINEIYYERQVCWHCGGVVRPLTSSKPLPEDLRQPGGMRGLRVRLMTGGFSR